MSAPLDVTLTTLAYGGDALGRLEDGRAVFVPFGAPGERVRIRITEERGHFARGEIVEVLNASAERIVPRCRHFGACGGCHFQHLSYENQVRAKTDILRDQLIRIGHIGAPPLAPMVASADPWNYRNHVQFHLDQQGRLGFMGAGSPSDREQVLPIEECHLPTENLNALWPHLQMDASAGVERVVLRSGSDNDVMLVLNGSAAHPPELELEAAVSVAHVFDEDVLMLAGEDHIRLTVRGRESRVSPTSFFQVNLGITEKVVEHVLDAMPQAAKTIVDAYCGVGLFSALLAPRCQRLIGIESSPAATADFAVNLDEFDNVELYEDTVERVLPTLDLHPDVILADPPRAGLGRIVVDEISRLKPARMIYVSCDPATLARDCSQLLKAGFQLESVTPFDMFPQTYHIESVSIFRR